MGECDCLLSGRLELQLCTYWENELKVNEFKVNLKQGDIIFEIRYLFLTTYRNYYKGASSSFYALENPERVTKGKKKQGWGVLKQQWKSWRKI